MKKNKFIALWIPVVLILGVLLVYGPAKADGFVLIVNMDNAIDQISSRSIRQIYLYRQVHWSDGAAINIVLNDASPYYPDFSRLMLGKSPSVPDFLQKAFI